MREIKEELERLNLLDKHKNYVNSQSELQQYGWSGERKSNFYFDFYIVCLLRSLKSILAQITAVSRSVFDNFES